jgi:hypothetical protein
MTARILYEDPAARALLVDVAYKTDEPDPTTMSFGTFQDLSSVRYIASHQAEVAEQNSILSVLFSRYLGE